MGESTDCLLKALISLTGRVAFSEVGLLKIIAPVKKGREKLVEAYNLCNGMRTQSEITKLLKLHEGNFSVKVNRWIEEGVLFRIPYDDGVCLLHVFPISKNALKGELDG